MKLVIMISKKVFMQVMDLQKEYLKIRKHYIIQSRESKLKIILLLNSPEIHIRSYPFPNPTDGHLKMF